jgi:hypothetical protein
METIIGFVVGYLVGSKEGKGGLERLKVSLGAIASSPEARKLLGEAISMAEPIMKKASGAGLSNLGGIGGTVVKQLIDRAAAAGETSRAA